LVKATGDENFNTRNRVKNEFNRVNTELEISDDQTTPNNSLITLSSNYAEELLNWVYNYVPPDEPKNNFVRLYGMRGYIQGSGFPANSAFSGIMIPATSGEDKHGYAFVFEELLSAGFRKEGRVYTTVHELGHARVMRLENIESYVWFLSTNEQEHRDGHNGTYKNTCVMHWSSTRTTEQMKYLYERPRFCEGHKQMLLNVSWVEE